MSAIFVIVGVNVDINAIVADSTAPLERRPKRRSCCLSRELVTSADAPSEFLQFCCHSG